MRRQSKVSIQIPIFIDTKTPRPFIENLPSSADPDSVAIEDHIYLDAMGFGMGCCCLQVTFQAQSIDEARFLYDQLTPLTPIMVVDRFSFLSFPFLINFFSVSVGFERCFTDLARIFN